MRGNPWDMDKGTQMLLVIVPRRVKALQLQKKLKIFFFRGTNTWGCPTVEEHRESKKVVGIKQVKKALREGRALEVILADDADPALIEPLEGACLEAGVPTTRTASMKELGRACSIAVGAACAAYVR